jgi:hypothetical protein
MFKCQLERYALGSDHSRSQSRPSLGMSVGLLIELIRLNSLRCGLIPPCMQSMLSSMTAAIGSELKQSTKYFHVLIEYFLLPDLFYEYTISKTHTVC